MAGDKQIVAKGKGYVEIKNNNGLKIKFKNILFSPELQMKLISANRVVEKGLTAKFNSTSGTIQHSDGTVVLKTVRRKICFLAKDESHRLYAAVSSSQTTD